MKYVQLFFSLLPLSLWALPQGEDVKAGNVLFSKEGTMLHVTASDSAVIEYDSFNIAKGETVRFIQPKSTSTLLNRVKGESSSAIFGQLKANGKVFLINPNGIIFGETAYIDTHSLIASTLDILNTDFVKGNFHFFLTEGSESSKICNQGVLRAEPGGAIALLAPHILNEGHILADVGSVLLASVEKIVIDLAGDGLLHFAIEGALRDAWLDGTLPFDPAAIQKVLEEIVNTEGLIPSSKMIEEGGLVRLVSSSHIEAEEISIRASHVQLEGSLMSKGNLDVEADAILCMRDRENELLKIQSGGSFTLKGDFIDIYALRSPATRIVSGDDMVFMSRHPISLDGHFYAGGRFLLHDFEGAPASFFSLYDPYIVSSTSSGGVGVEFGAYSGSSLKVVAQGSISCLGDISITVSEPSACNGGCSDPDCETLATELALILEAGTVPIAGCGIPTPTTQEGVTFDPSSSGSTIFLRGNVSNCNYVAFTGGVVLENDVTISLLSNGTFSCANDINGDGSTPHSLTFQGTNAEITVTGSIGNTTALNNLTTNVGTFTVMGIQGITASTITTSNEAWNITGLVNVTAGGFSIANTVVQQFLGGISANFISITSESITLSQNFTGQTGLITLNPLSSIFISGPQVTLMGTGINLGIVSADTSTSLTLNATSTPLFLSNDITMDGQLTLFSSSPMTIASSEISANGGISVNTAAIIGGSGAVALTSQNYPIVFSSAITLAGGGVTMTSNGGEISLNAVSPAMSGSNFSLDLVAGNGAVFLNGAISGDSFTVTSSGSIGPNTALSPAPPPPTFTAGSVSLTSSGGISVSDITTTSANTVVVSGSGDVTISNINTTSGSGAEIAITDMGGSSASLNVGGDLTADGNLTISGTAPLVLDANATWTSNTGSILLGLPTINLESFTLNLNSDVTNTASGVGITIVGTGPVALFSNIETNDGAITIQAPLELMAVNPQITSAGGAITLANISGAEDLSVNAGSGNAFFNGVINVSSLSVVATDSTISEGITTTGDVTFNTSENFLGGTITAGGDILFSAPQNIVVGQNTVYTTSGGNITFNGTIDDISSGSNALNLQALTGTVEFDDVIGFSAPMKSLSVNAATINMPAQFYEANTITLIGNIQLTAGALTQLLSGQGGIAINSPSIVQLSAGTNLLVDTHGGPFSFSEILGTSGESVAIFSGVGNLSLGEMGALGNLLGAVVAFGGQVVFNGPVFADSVNISSQGAVLNSGIGTTTITTAGNASFNAFKGTVGTMTTPIDVQAGGIVTAGAPSLLANFNGTTLDGTININPLNPPCPVIFNGQTIRICPPPSPPSPPPPPSPSSLMSTIPARDFYVPGIYSQYDSLATGFYFFPEIVTSSYTALKSNLLYLTEKLYEKDKIALKKFY
jgi:filamentous hemagglutinin family protein